ncbi:hypothetical protein BDV33DRAFT_162124 [Aspergillus novoparasiticus]|uniref:Uncharacterized protein n=1 Tax=Aspergillus novoparasiticus TaxID=986946 RepID=A0A5N6FB50_9EURO|nr:hypothetical protein BDV33DRAFT_162124 [Aspergillus novoparasiticus]
MRCILPSKIAILPRRVIAARAKFLPIARCQNMTSSSGQCPRINCLGLALQPKNLDRVYLRRALSTPTRCLTRYCPSCDNRPLASMFVMWRWVRLGPFNQSDRSEFDERNTRGRLETTRGRSARPAGFEGKQYDMMMNSMIRDRRTETATTDLRSETVHSRKTIPRDGLHHSETLPLKHLTIDVKLLMAHARGSIGKSGLEKS